MKQKQGGAELQEAERERYFSAINEELSKSNNKSTFSRFTESADEYKKASDKYNLDSSDINKKQGGAGYSQNKNGRFLFRNI